MSIGQTVRRILGPSFDAVARIYRSYYVDLDSFAARFSGLEDISSVLEIGCGDGHLVEAMTSVMPDVSVLGIDVADDPGSLFKGDDARVQFRTIPAEALLDQGEHFDLVVMCDVLHHVPEQDREALMSTAWELARPGGYLAVKDWVSTRNLATTLAYLSDTYVTADRPSFFGTRDEFTQLVLPGSSVVADEGWIPPHQNNVYLIASKSDG